MAEKKPLRFNPNAKSFVPGGGSFVPTAMLQKKAEPKKEEPVKEETKKEEPKKEESKEEEEKKEENVPKSEEKEEEKAVKQENKIDPAVLQEQRRKKVAECEQFKLAKPHVNIMFIGHVGEHSAL